MSEQDELLLTQLEIDIVDSKGVVEGDIVPYLEAQLAKVKQHYEQKRLHRPDRQKIFAILDKEYIGDDDKEASHEHHNQVLDQIEALFDKDRPFGTAQGEPELREKIRNILLAFSDKWNGMCMISCHYLPCKRMWENCQFRSDCQDELIDLLQALIPDEGEIRRDINKGWIKVMEEMEGAIEEAKKQKRIDIANKILEGLRLLPHLSEPNAELNNINSYISGVVKALKEEK